VGGISQGGLSDRGGFSNAKLRHTTLQFAEVEYIFGVEALCCVAGVIDSHRQYELLASQCALPPHAEVAGSTKWRNVIHGNMTAAAA